MPNQAWWLHFCMLDSQLSFLLGHTTLEVLTDASCHPDESFLVMNLFAPPRIFVGTNGPQKDMALAHELGHLLEYMFIRARRCDTERQEFRREVMAWRIAKAFMKPALWDEDIALQYIYDYVRIFHINIHWHKFKLIPY